MDKYLVSIFVNDRKSSVEEFNNLMGGLMYVGSILNDMKIINCIDKGEIMTNKSFGKLYHKTYKITNEIPNCEILIYKKSAGNLDEKALQIYLEKVKELYERNNN